jgi:glutamyl-tRNA synthetase
MANLAQPVRVALTGKTASPGLFEIIHLLGREEALRRIQHAVEFAEHS